MGFTLVLARLCRSTGAAWGRANDSHGPLIVPEGKAIWRGAEALRAPERAKCHRISGFGTGATLTWPPPLLRPALHQRFSWSRRFLLSGGGPSPTPGKGLSPGLYDATPSEESPRDGEPGVLTPERSVRGN